MIRNLVVSGGSTKTLAAIGCIRYLEEMHMMRDIISFVGTSAGSILCLMCCLGYTSDEMIAILEKEMITENRGQLSFDELLDLNVLNSYGLDSGENMQMFIEQIVNEKLGRTSITFVELAKITGKNLVICVANLSKQQQEYMDVDTEPHMDVVKAIRMSISLPFIFTPVLHNGNIYVDGALYETLPVGYIMRFKDPLKDTIAIHTRTVIDTTINSFSDYISVLFSSVVDKANSGKTKCKKINMMEIVFDDDTSIPIDVQTLQFDINKMIIQKSIDKGYAAIKQRFEERNS
jgi:predicted acylesterase/phospholipase RssA